MEALSRKTEKEKLVELEAMLADATISGDMTDVAGSGSSSSELRTPVKHHHCPTSPREEPRTNSPVPWRPVTLGWSGKHSFKVNRCGDAQTSIVENLRSREEDVTARIYSSSSSTTGSPVEEARARRHQQDLHRRSSRRRRRHQRGNASDGRRTSSTAERDETTTATAATVALLRSELQASRSQLEQKEVVTRSLQRQLDKQGEIEAHTQARAEEDLVAALAKASGLKEELARTSQLLVEGALARQQLEQRCSLLTQDLHKSVARAAELEEELSVSRAELVRISGALHARRSTDVVDAERAFGEELQRVQETATRDSRGLRQEVSDLRTSLEQSKIKFRKTCGERDSWREEAEVLSSEVSTLRETVQALRQYSENDTIDQLLGQVSRWKRRAEELESLQRVVSSPERSAFDSSNSDAGVGQNMDPVELVLSPKVGGGTPLGTLNQVRSPLPRHEEKQEVAGREDESDKFALRRELSEAKEKLAMMEEEVAGAVLATREEAEKRIAAESHVENLQREAEANGRAARENMVARRAAKARDMANLKIAIRQDMMNELFKLQREMREQTQDDQPLDTSAAAPLAHQSEQHVGVDKACQVDGATPHSNEGRRLVVQHDAVPKLCSACLSCGVDKIDTTTGVSAVACPAAVVVAEKEAQARTSAAMASASVAQAEARAWESAFSSARHLFHGALVSLCDRETGVFGPKLGGRADVIVPPFSVVESSACSSGSTSAVVPWVPDEVKTEAAAALEALRDRIESAVQGIRLAAKRTVQTAERSTSTVTKTSQTSPQLLGALATTVSLSTTGSQTDDRTINGRGRGISRHDVGVQASLGVRIEVTSCAGRTCEAPAWEGGVDGRCFEDNKSYGDVERLPKPDSDMRMEELARTAEALSNALQRTEAEKENLMHKLTLRFERENAMQLKEQRDVFEADIAKLHASTMALVREFSCGSNGVHVTSDPLVKARDGYI